MENIPPMSDALLQHACKRATYQASIWTSSHNSQQNQSTPDSWGWNWDEHDKVWIPVWTTQPIASSACMEFVKCSCKSEKGCGTRCSCKKPVYRALVYVNVTVYLKIQKTFLHRDYIYLFCKID